MSAAIELADRMRGPHGVHFELSALHTAAAKDGAKIAAALAAAAQKGGKVAAELMGHARADDITGLIFTHAMLHSGHLVEAATGERWPTCPRCGADLTAA